MDSFTGFKNAAGEEVPEARAVMDPFHVVSLTGAKLDECRRRVQHETAGCRGRKVNPLYQARRTLRTDAGMLTDTQAERLERCSPTSATLRSRPLGASTSASSRPTAPSGTGLGRFLMQRLIDSPKQAVPDGLDEIQILAKTLAERAADILAYFDHPRTSNGPTEAIDGHLEHLRGIALIFRNLTH